MSMEPTTTINWFVVNRYPAGDFTEPVEDMLQDYIKAQWGLFEPVSPAVSTNPPSDWSTNIRFGDFEYDYFSTYYIRVREGDTEFDNDLISEGGNFTMKTPINIDLTARRLRYGEHFEELNNMRLEVLRILGNYRPDDISGIYHIEIDRPGERDIESRNFETAGRAPRTIWYLRITAILHYMKGYTCMIMPPMEMGKFSMYVPLFIYPNRSTNPLNYSWTPLINSIKNSGNQTKWAVTINIDSGPGITENIDYSNALLDLRDAATQSGADLTIMGYVATDYGNRDFTLVDDDINTWFSLYGDKLDGIFFDQVPTVTGHEAYYQARVNHAKSKWTDCACWGSPGTAIDEGYVNVFDTIVIAETNNASRLDIDTLMQTTFNNTYSTEKFAVIVHGQSTFDENYMNEVIRPHAAYYYTTNDVMPNPYDTFPTYLQDEVDAIKEEM